MNDEQRIMVALRAENELALTEAAFEGLNIALTNRLVATDFTDRDERERIYVALKTLGLVRQTLVDAVAAGKSARAVIDYEKQLAESGLTASA